MTVQTKLEQRPMIFNRLFWLHWIALIWTLGSAVWAVWLVVQTVQNCLPGAQVQLTLPASQDYPQSAGTVSYSGGSYVVPGTSVTFTQASLLVSHLPISSAILLGLGQFLTALTSAGVGWCVVMLVRKLRDDEPFAASTARALVAAGLILAIGITAGSIATAAGGIGLFIGYSAKYGFLSLDPGNLTINLMPFFLAGVLFALASVFRYGARLEADRARLQRETEGLV